MDPAQVFIISVWVMAIRVEIGVEDEGIFNLPAISPLEFLNYP